MILLKIFGHYVFPEHYKPKVVDVTSKGGRKQVIKSYPKPFLQMLG